MLPKGVDHDIADKMNFFRSNSFVAQVVFAALLGDEQEVADGVGEDAVDLLGHVAIKRTQAGFHMYDDGAFAGWWEPGTGFPIFNFRGHQGAGNG